jgi:hypothetical protein
MPVARHTRALLERGGWVNPCLDNASYAAATAFHRFTKLEGVPAEIRMAPARHRP